jgi:DNA mismatch endonuclease (patch repair protein)
MGYRYRLHRADLPGTPDLVFSSRRKVIFVHGCFWHAHSGCKRASVPDQNHQYWETKLASNVTRDRKAIATLRKIGWHSLVIWECQLADEAKLKRKIARFLDR